MRVLMHVESSLMPFKRTKTTSKSLKSGQNQKNSFQRIVLAVHVAANNQKSIMKNKVRITAIRQTVYPDLMARYENPITHTCDVREGQQWISVDGKCPAGMCPSAWSSMREFVESLANGEGNFYDGWMKNPMSAMISCNDGFRPFSFYIEVI